jgi:hypothetical protein
MTDRLVAIGDWLRENGDSIRGCKKSPFRNTPWGRATTKGSTVYLHVYDWPKDGELVIRGLENPALRASLVRDPASRLLGGADPAALSRAISGNLAFWRDVEGALHVDVRGHAPSEHATVVAIDVEGAVRTDGCWHRDDSGTISLPVRDAAVVSAALKVDGKGDLVSWTSTADRVAWGLVRFAEGVEYEAQADLSFADGEDGGEIEFAIGHLSTTVAVDSKAGAGANPGFRSVTLGRIASPTGGGPVEVALRAVRISEKRFGSLRALRFVPVGAQFAGGAVKSALMQNLFGGMVDTVSRQILAASSLQEGPREGSQENFAGAFYAEDAVVVPADGSVVKGRDAIGKWLVGLAPRLLHTRVLTTRLVAQSDGSFVQFGRYALDERLRLKPKTEGVVPMTGEFVRVWRRVNAGVLHVVSETWWN